MLLSPEFCRIVTFAALPSMSTLSSVTFEALLSSSVSTAPLGAEEGDLLAARERLWWPWLPAATFRVLFAGAAV